MTDPSREAIRLLSYNIHGCIGNDSRYDADRILRVIRNIDADVVALQEVYDELPLDRQFLKSLNQLPYPHIQYGMTLKHESRGDYGNLLLSKWPLTNVELIDISVAGREPRGAIRAQIKTPQRTLDLTVAHLGLSPKERIEQVARLFQQWGNAITDVPQGHAFVFMGDLNEWIPQSRLIQSLSQSIGFTTPQATFPSAQPTLALDQIFVHPPRLIDQRHAIDTALTRVASDHLPIVAELQPQRRII